MTDKNEQASAGAASELNAELGFKVGDKCLVVFRPNFLHNPEDGIVIECCIDGIEQTIKTTSKSEESNKKYIVSFGLDMTTVDNDVLFSLDKKQLAHELAESFLTESIESAKNRIKKLEAALLMVKT